MSLCINPNCQNPKNPDDILYCQSCGSELLLEGRYRVKCNVGKGGFAKTFEVDDGSKVAKILKILTSNTPKAILLFKQEAEILKQLDIPGIPYAEDYFQFFPYNSQQVVYCLVMEKIEGDNLQSWLEKRNNRPINEKLAIHWLINISNILHEVHKKQFFHRDIKPSNIMLKADGQLVLIDFGIAREVSETYEKKQAAGQITRVLSDGYAPREQDLGQAVPQSDFFALGRTFVHLLTGKHPTELMDDPYGDPCSVINWRNQTDNISDLLADFIDNLMAPAVKKRPANTQIILDRLSKISNILSPVKKTTLPVSILAPFINYNNIKLAYTIGGWTSGHSDAVLCVAISPNGKVLASGSKDRTIKLWNLETGDEILTFDEMHRDYITCLAISPNGETIISASNDKSIKIWDINTGEMIHNLIGHKAEILSIAVSSDGQNLASGSADNTIKVWKLSTGKEIRCFVGHKNPVKSVKIGINGQFLFSGSLDGTIKLWPGGSNLISADTHILSLAVSSDEQYLISSHYDPIFKSSNIIFFNIKSQKINEWKENSIITSLAISPDNAIIFSGRDNGTIKVSDFNKYKEIYTLRDHLDTVTSLAISCDGKTMASASCDGTIKVWQINY